MLSERIKEIRKYLKITTQEELANILEMKISRIQDIERGKVKELKANEIVNFQEKLLVNSWWLLTGIGNITINNKNHKEEILEILENSSDKEIECFYHLIKAEIIKKDL